METKKETAPGTRTETYERIAENVVTLDAKLVKNSGKNKSLVEIPRPEEVVSVAENLAKGEVSDVTEHGRIRITDDIPPTEFLLYQNGIGTLPRRSIATIKGKPGEGKSLSCAVFIAAILGCREFGFDVISEDNTVIYFDTEKNKENTLNLAKKVHRALGWDENNDNDRLRLYNYKSDAVEDRLKLVYDVTNELHPDAIVVDGIVDCIENYNDLEESKSVVEELNRFSAQADVVIICVLHTNKNDDNSQGHLGHFLLKKSHNEFQLKNEGGSFVITHTKSNDGHIRDIVFGLDSELTPRTTDSQKNVNLRNLFKRIFEGNSDHMTTSEIVNKFKKLTGNEKRTANSKISDAVKTGVIKCVERGIYALYQ